MSLADARREQLLPKLTPAEIARLRRMGSVCRYSAGQRLFSAGEPSPGMFVILSGSVAVTRRDGLGHVTPIIEAEPGHFLAEVGDLSGRPALVDAQAVSDVEALLIRRRACARCSSPRPNSATRSCARSSCGARP